MNFNNVTLKQLKEYCVQNGITVQGNKSKKQSYINSIQNYYGSSLTVTRPNNTQTQSVTQTIDPNHFNDYVTLDVSSGDVWGNGITQVKRVEYQETKTEQTAQAALRNLVHVNAPTSYCRMHGSRL